MTMMYTEQSLANIQAFLEDEKYTKRRLVLQKISQLFEANHIKWGLACSSPLFFLGIQDDFHDFDILVAPNDAEIADQLLQTIAEKENPELTPARNRYFDDDYFGKFKIDGAELDVISEFGIQTFGTGYKYHFEAEKIENLKVCNDFIVPAIPLEAQFVLYLMMTGWQPQRRFKKELIGNFLKEKGLKHPEVFEDALCNHALPYWAKAEIRQLLEVQNIKE